MAVTYDKDGAYIEITENGVTYRRAIRLEDGVVSLVDPDGTYKKVDLVRVNASDQLVLTLEDESEVTVSGTGDMLKSVYDTDESGVVDNAEKLEGSTKSEVQDHTPKAHTLASHSTKPHSALTGVTTSQHHTKYTDAEAVAAAKAALDYGLSFEGIVTTAVSATHFKVSTLAGKGTGFFIPNTGDPYEIYVVKADGAAPEGLHTPVLSYDTSDGDFGHADFVTDDLEVGDVVLFMHPWLAFIKDILTDTGTTIPGTITTLQSNVSTILGRITAAVALASSLTTHDTDIKNLLSTIAGYLTTEIADILTILGTPANFMADLSTLESRLSATRADYLDQLDFALQEAIAAIPTASEIQTEIEANGASILDTLQDRLTATRAGYLNQLDFALQEAIAALPQTMVGTNNAALASVLGALANAAAEGAVTESDTVMAYVKQLVTLLLEGTYGLSALQTLLAAITAAGPTKSEMDTAHALLTTPAQVATALNTYDAVKRSEATSDKNAVIAAIPAMVGTDGAALASAWTAALATILGNFSSTNIGYLDELAAANLPTDVAALNTLLSSGTYGLSALKTLIDAVDDLVVALRGGVEGIHDIKESQDAELDTARGKYTKTMTGGEDNLYGESSDTEFRLQEFMVDLHNMDTDDVIVFRIYTTEDGVERKISTDADLTFSNAQDPARVTIINAANQVWGREDISVTAEQTGTGTLREIVCYWRDAKRGG